MREILMGKGREGVLKEKKSTRNYALGRGGGLEKTFSQERERKKKDNQKGGEDEKRRENQTLQAARGGRRNVEESQRYTGEGKVRSSSWQLRRKELGKEQRIGPRGHQPPDLELQAAPGIKL